MSDPDPLPLSLVDPRLLDMSLWVLSGLSVVLFVSLSDHIPGGLGVPAWVHPEVKFSVVERAAELEHWAVRFWRDDLAQFIQFL